MVPLMYTAVPKHIGLEVLGLALSEKQIPQIVENNQSGTERIEPLERTGVRPRQMRYQAARLPIPPALLIRREFASETSSRARLSLPLFAPFLSTSVRGCGHYRSRRVTTRMPSLLRWLAHQTFLGDNKGVFSKAL